MSLNTLVVFFSHFYQIFWAPWYSSLLVLAPSTRFTWFQLVLDARYLRLVAGPWVCMRLSVVSCSGEATFMRSWETIYFYKVMWDHFDACSLLFQAWGGISVIPYHCFSVSSCPRVKFLRFLLCVLYPCGLSIYFEGSHKCLKCVWTGQYIQPVHIIYGLFHLFTLLGRAEGVSFFLFIFLL